MNYKAVISNPPYSLKWSADESLSIGEMPLSPKSKADFQFVLEGVSRLEDDGIAAYVLPHGVLFRGNTERKIRQELIERNYLDAVIGLPDHLFDVTSIPVCLMIFKKQRSTTDVLFIDAAREFTKSKNKNLLEPEHVNKIVKAYHDRAEIERYSTNVTLQDIKENDYNLNIPRYVDTFEPEPVIALDDIMAEMKEINAEELHLQQELDTMMSQLRGTTPEADAEIKRFYNFFHKNVKQKEQMTLL